MHGHAEEPHGLVTDQGDVGGRLLEAGDEGPVRGLDAEPGGQLAEEGLAGWQVLLVEIQDLEVRRQCSSPTADAPPDTQAPRTSSCSRPTSIAVVLHKNPVVCAKCTSGSPPTRE